MADSETKSIIIGVAGVAAAELVSSVQLTCLIYHEFLPLVDAMMAWTWFGMFIPALVLYCASHVRLFGRGVATVIFGLVATLGGLGTLISSMMFSGKAETWSSSLQERLLVSGFFFTTLGVGIIRATSRSYLIATTAPEKHGFVQALASVAAGVVTAIHMFIVQGAVIDAIDFEAPTNKPDIRFVICESVFGFIGCVLSGGFFVDLRTLTDGPLALTLERRGNDEPIFKLAKPFMFAISGYFLMQVMAAGQVTAKSPDDRATYYTIFTSLSRTFRAIGVFHVGALVGAAPFMVKPFQGKGCLVLLQIVATIFITGLAIADSVASLTALYAFGGLGLGALRAAMFAFLGETVTPESNAESVGIFVSLGLMAQAIAFGLIYTMTEFRTFDDYDITEFRAFDGYAMCYACPIAVAILVMLRLPSSPPRDDPQP